MSSQSSPVYFWLGDGDYNMSFKNALLGEAVGFFGFLKKTPPGEIQYVSYIVTFEIRKAKLHLKAATLSKTCKHNYVILVLINFLGLPWLSCFLWVSIFPFLLSHFISLFGEVKNS